MFPGNWLITPELFAITTLVFETSLVSNVVPSSITMSFTNAFSVLSPSLNNPKLDCSLTSTSSYPASLLLKGISLNVLPNSTEYHASPTPSGVALESIHSKFSSKIGLLFKVVNSMVSNFAKPVPLSMILFEETS